MSTNTTAFSRACEVLRRSGRNVQPSDIPGLTWVDGRELTVGQVIDLSAEIDPCPHPVDWAEFNEWHDRRKAL